MTLSPRVRLRAAWSSGSWSGSYPEGREFESRRRNQGSNGGARGLLLSFPGGNDRPLGALRQPNRAIARQHLLELLQTEPVLERRQHRQRGDIAAAHTDRKSVV